MKTNIYIDGFNLYYGCIKDTPYHWLNLAEMCRLLLPKDKIQRIKYFTALVTSRPNDPDQPLRQRVFLRALQTIPNLEIILGSTVVGHVSSVTLIPPPFLPSFNPIILPLRIIPLGAQFGRMSGCDGKSALNKEDSFMAFTRQRINCIHYSVMFAIMNAVSCNHQARDKHAT